jgi:hypothetical protein
MNNMRAFFYARIGDYDGDGQIDGAQRGDYNERVFFDLGWVSL